jgi:soluble lytic murein transglycosylase-like protein
MIEGGGEIVLPSEQIVAIRIVPAADPTPPGGSGSASPSSAAAPVAAPAREDGPIQASPGAVFDPLALRDLASRVARRHEVDESLVLAMIEVESRYDAFAVSPRGAMGLMQLMPRTAARFSVTNAFDPVQNMEGGVRYLKELLRRYGGQVRLALAAYNAGEEAVDRFRGIPPYRETEQYVVKVLRIQEP